MSDIIKNEVVSAIMARRSIRAYKKDQIAKQELETILECGFNAPSGMNRQQWFVTVIQDAVLLREISEASKKATLANPELPEAMKARFSAPDYSMFFGAPTVMLICCPTGGGVVMGVSNACFLAENMVIAAQSLGIGSCYLGGPAAFFNSPEGRVFTEKFGIPEGYTVAYAITFGYPDQSPEAKPRDMSKYKLI